MTDTAISPLRRRLIEDMAIRRLSPKTQLHYIRHVKRFADFLGRSADKATAEDVHRYQLWLASFGTTVPTLNAGASALRFFFRVTLKRRDLAEAVVSVREPRRLPVRAGRDRIEKDPDQRVQEALSLVFAKFAELHSVRQVHVWLRDEGIALPVACHGAAEGRSIAWRLPLYNTVHNILTNPVYAGAYAFGRTMSKVSVEAGRKRIKRGLRRPQSEFCAVSAIRGAEVKPPARPPGHPFAASRKMIGSTRKRPFRYLVSWCGSSFGKTRLMR